VDLAHAQPTFSDKGYEFFMLLMIWIQDFVAISGGYNVTEKKLRGVVIRHPFFLLSMPKSLRAWIGAFQNPLKNVGGLSEV
tara:strand:+ start:278 stop:520 length:243 start_codon:yes stop_codon:yes gene_type:complete